VLAKVRALPDVDARGRRSIDQAKLIGRDGKIISSTAPKPPPSASTSHDSRFDPLKLEAGQWPVGSTEVAIDQKTANDEGFDVGDTIGVRPRGRCASSPSPES
jgi:hypothetical protein